jgi:hypothetical protein
MGPLLGQAVEGRLEGAAVLLDERVAVVGPSDARRM